MTLSRHVAYFSRPPQQVLLFLFTNRPSGSPPLDEKFLFLTQDTWTSQPKLWPFVVPLAARDCKNVWPKEQGTSHRLWRFTAVAIKMQNANTSFCQRHASNIFSKRNEELQQSRLIVIHGTRPVVVWCWAYFFFFFAFPPLSLSRLAIICLT